jgi:branched-chain amino acid transport system substrate-binding protein
MLVAALAVALSGPSCAREQPSSTEAPEARPIVLGAPLSTGFLYGWDAERGIRLAVEEINAAGGVDVGDVKRPFKVEVVDARDLEPGVPCSEALLAAEKLILDKEADFIVGGPVRSEAALAAMDLMARYKKVSILTSGSLTPKYHQKVAQEYDRYKYCFRLSGEAGWMVREIVEVLETIRADHAFDKVYILVQDVAHARAGGDILDKLLSERGWAVLGLDVYPTGTTDFSTGLVRVKERQAQILILWMDMPESSILLKQWHDMKVPALPFGSILAAAEQPGFWEATEGKGQYTLANLVNAGNAATTLSDWAMRFYKSYEQRWGIPPEGYGASSSYMAPYVLQDAIERAQSLDPEAVIRALEETDLMGVYGRIRFDSKSHQVIPSQDPEQGAVGTIIQWQAGERVTIYPPKAAVGTLQLPPWMKSARSAGQ